VVPNLVLQALAEESPALAWARMVQKMNLGTPLLNSSEGINTYNLRHSEYLVHSNGWNNSRGYGLSSHRFLLILYAPGLEVVERASAITISDTRVKLSVKYAL
jgi:hypothetical protein